MTIRPATLADVPDLVALGCRFRATSAYATLIAESRETMAATAARLIDQADGVVFVTETRGGALTAMIGLLSFLHHLSGERTVGEVFFFSEAPGAGLRLLHHAETWAREHGATSMQMIQPYHETRVGHLYARRGYRAIEVAWQRSLP
jgi:GNAT superfamily N-acetyltransferase